MNTVAGSESPDEETLRRPPRRTNRAEARAKQRPYGRTEVREALLDAAQRLIAKRGPSGVTLREIADEADVNFGLVYQYLGTKETVLREVYQRVANRSAVRLSPVDQLADAVAALMTAPGTSIARIMAWTALDRDYPADVLGHFPALEHVAELIAGGPATEPQDTDRLLAAFLLVTTMGWRLFQSIGLTSAGLDPTPDPQRDEQITAWLQQFAAMVTES